MNMSNCILDSDDAYFDAFTRRAAEARVPLDASIEITHRCNLRCVHCYLGDQKAIRQNRSDELSTAEVKRLLDDMAAAGTLNFTFTGGDPMVRKDFPELYEHAIRKGFLVTVFCDGAVITNSHVALSEGWSSVGSQCRVLLGQLSAENVLSPCRFGAMTRPGRCSSAGARTSSSSWVRSRPRFRPRETRPVRWFQFAFAVACPSWVP